MEEKNNEYNQYFYYRDKAEFSKTFLNYDLFEVVIEENNNVYHLLKVFKDRYEITDELKLGFEKLGYIVIYGNKYNLKSADDRFSVVKPERDLTCNNLIEELGDNIYSLLNIEITTDSIFKDYVVGFIEANSIEKVYMQMFLFSLLKEDIYLKEEDIHQINYINSLEKLKMYLYTNYSETRLSEFVEDFIYNRGFALRQPKAFYNELMKKLINVSLNDKVFVNNIVNELIIKASLKYKTFDDSGLTSLIYDIEEDDNEEEEHSVDRRKKKLKMK